MSVASTPDLFSGQFDTAIEAFMQIAQAKDQHDVRDMAKTLGDAVVRKTYDWALINLEADYAVDLDWITAKGHHKGGMIGVDTFTRLVGIIGHATDSELRLAKVRGVLVGLDSKKRRFRFVDPEGDDYAGPLSETFPAAQIWQVNESYIANIEIEETVDYATEVVKRTNRLKHLEPISKMLV